MCDKFKCFNCRSEISYDDIRLQCPKCLSVSVRAINPKMLNLYVFCNNWAHDDYGYYHPEMAIATDKDSAMAMFLNANKQFGSFEFNKDNANKFTINYKDGIGNADFFIVTYSIKKGYITDI